MPTLYLIRGIPGSGKSTFAEELKFLINMSSPHDTTVYPIVVHVEADMFMTNLDGSYLYDPRNLGFAHSECQRITEQELSAGNDVIVSNTSTTEKEVKVYKDLADKYNATFVSLIVENRHDGKNTHDVPEEKLQKMKQRFSIKL